MKPLIAFAAALLVAVPAFAGNAVSDMHPEEAYPDNAPVLVSPGPYGDLLKQVQEKLHALDFDPGPVNGASSSKLQAALAQFQLSEALPASGMLDQRTLLALGLDPAELVTVQPDAAAGEDAAAGGSAD
jgi:peptidoglycan hydrolase-like protein with peptidoglycan-binding domain